MSDYAAKLRELREFEYGNPASPPQSLYVKWLEESAAHIIELESRLDQCSEICDGHLRAVDMLHADLKEARERLAACLAVFAQYDNGVVYDTDAFVRVREILRDGAVVENLRPIGHLCELHKLPVDAGGWCPKCDTEPHAAQSE
jgi:hypothetical protein